VAILNSMKNLSLGSNRNINKTPTTQDWETRWDEDDDSDDGEDDVQDQIQKQPSHPPSHAPPLPRPGMGVPAISSPAAVEPKTHLVTATPEQGTAEDGVEWDTGVFTPGEDYEKPNVHMFLPLLRVLGKGSFGKVCCLRTLDRISMTCG
jgi:hypothetical protein